MGTNRAVEQEHEDQLQVAFSEYVSFPDRVTAERTSRKRFDQVVDQAFDQAARMHKGRQLSHVPGLRLMGL